MNPAALRTETYDGRGHRLHRRSGLGRWSGNARAAAKAAGALVNVVDKPALCDFYTPAIVDRGAIVGAVGSTGSAPGLARRLKSELNARWPEGLGRVAAMIGGIKAAARDRPCPTSKHAAISSIRLLDSPAADSSAGGGLRTPPIGWRARRLSRPQKQRRYEGGENHRACNLRRPPGELLHQPTHAAAEDRTRRMSRFLPAHSFRRRSSRSPLV